MNVQSVTIFGTSGPHKRNTLFFPENNISAKQFPFLLHQDSSKAVKPSQCRQNLQSLDFPFLKRQIKFRVLREVFLFRLPSFPAFASVPLAKLALYVERLYVACGENILLGAFQSSSPASSYSLPLSKTILHKMSTKFSSDLTCQTHAREEGNDRRTWAEGGEGLHLHLATIASSLASSTTPMCGGGLLLLVFHEGGNEPQRSYPERGGQEIHFIPSGAPFSRELGVPKTRNRAPPHVLRESRGLSKRR